MLGDTAYDNRRPIAVEAVRAKARPSSHAQESFFASHLKPRTLANLSTVPSTAIDALRNVLAGETVVRVGEDGLPRLSRDRGN